MSAPSGAAPLAETPPPAGDATLTILVAAVLSSAVQTSVEMRAIIERASGRPGHNAADPVTPVVDAAFDLALRATAVTADAAVALGRLGRRVALMAPHPPTLPARFRPGTVLAQAADRGRAARIDADQMRAQVVGDLVTGVLDDVLDHVDLTQLVLDRVDLTSIIASVDIEDVFARIDLAGIVRQVIDEIDLPEIVRESSGAMASETVLGMRIRGIEADERVNRVVDRMLLHRRDRNAGAVQPDGDTDG